MEQMQINVPKGIKKKFLVYCPEMPHEAPSVYDQPPSLVELVENLLNYWD